MGELVKHEDYVLTPPWCIAIPRAKRVGVERVVALTVDGVPLIRLQMAMLAAWD